MYVWRFVLMPEKYQPGFSLRTTKTIDRLPGFNEKAEIPLLRSFSARDIANRMLALLDWAYALVAL
jgi:hypothetical protein